MRAHPAQNRYNPSWCPPGRRLPTKNLHERRFMKTALVSLLLAVSAATAFAQGGSGAPTAAGQAVTPEAASAAEKAVKARHDKRVAKKAAKKASAASAP